MPAPPLSSRVFPDDDPRRRSGGRWLYRLRKRAHPLLTTPAVLGLLLAVFGLEHGLRVQTRRLQAPLAALRQSREQTRIGLEHFGSLRDLKTIDVAQLKAGLSGLARSKRSLFEAGLSLQEERRLLEKHWEILTTYLMVNAPLQRVILMRGDEALRGYYISHVPPKAFGGAPEALPKTVRIVSKERFAHPERGKSEEVDGQLQWVPPQVGTSVRSNALGQYVLFTNSKLILHGPSVRPEDHEAFPHVCLGLSLPAAQRLYRNSFIGTRVVVISLDRAGG